MPASNFAIEPNVLPGVDVAPLLGESVWHSITLDKTILDVSREHFTSIKKDVQSRLPRCHGIRFLEVACYAHITGYLLAREFDARVSLFDVSASTLRLGRDIADREGLDPRNVRRVAGDFHSLPFDDSEFDVVYIASALHHTWRWRRVVAEMLRVLRPGGLLVLENEPCRRELCLYSFRTNRLDDLTEAERVLDRAGILRTIAEPYLGSRAEMLFGMTENQEMRLEHLIRSISETARVDEIIANPRICMGDFEAGADVAFRKGGAAAQRFVVEELQRRIAQAQDQWVSSRFGRLVDLPGPSQIAALGTKIQREVEQWRYGGCAPAQMAANLIGSDDESAVARLRALIEAKKAEVAAIQQARMFGAGVRIVAAKVVAEGPREWRRTSRMGVADDVELAFDSDTLALMSAERNLIPPLQGSDVRAIRGFLGQDWELVEQTLEADTTIRLANPIARTPGFRLPLCLSEHLLLVFRVYVGFEQGPWRLSLSVNGRPACHLDVLKSDSALLVATVPNALGQPDISFERLPLGGELPSSCPFNIAYAAAIRIPV